MPCRLLLLIAPLALAACGEADNKAATPAQPAAPAAGAGAGEAAGITPGRWQVASTIVGTEGTQREHLCITQEQARSGRFLLGDLPDGCTVGRNSMASGRIDFALTCGQLSSTFTGTYDARSYRTEAELDLAWGRRCALPASAHSPARSARPAISG